MASKSEKLYTGDECRQFKSILNTFMSDEGDEVMLVLEVGFVDINNEVIEKPWVAEPHLRKILSFISKLYHAGVFPTIGCSIDTGIALETVSDIEYSEKNGDVMVTVWLV